MQTTQLLTSRLFSVKEEGGLEQASRELAKRSEAQIVRWVQFPAGVLFFTLVPGDPESGAIFIFSRRERVF